MTTIEPQLGAQAYTSSVLRKLAESAPDRVFVEVSGGHDSTAMLWAVAESDELELDGVVHLNTGIGAEYTRQYVRKQCARLGLPFIEVRQPDPEQRYGPKVIKHGFPGANPIAHEMHRRDLKQDPEDILVQSFDGDIVILTGVNRYESNRRKKTVAQSGIQPDNRHSWVTYGGPIAEYTGTEIREVLERHDVDRNELADLFDSSGECLCGSFASFWQLSVIWEYEPELVLCILHLMTLANLYWTAYLEEHGEPPYPRQYLIWGHGGVGEGALAMMVNGSLDDPADFADSDVDKRADSADQDEDQLDLSDKCASCNYGPVVTE